MLCARTGSVDAVKALVAHGADVNAREPLRGQTALMWAVAQEHPDVVRVLLEHGADVRARSRLRRLVVNRGDPNDIYTAFVGEVSRGGSTALLFAAAQGDIESTTLLLDAGADVNDAAPDGASALVFAAHSGHGSLANLLLDRGANPNAISAGYAALHAAVLRGDLHLVRSLLAHGARVNAQIRNGTATTRASRDFFLPETLVGATPFLLAAKFLEVDIMRVLAASGADTRLTLKDGTTPLMVAAGLLSQGSLFDRLDRVALTRASNEDIALQAVKLTIELRADVNATNEQGNTAVHGAAVHGYGAVVQFLAQRGASLDVKNRKGDTPLKVSAGSEMTAVLRALGAKE
jgi:ankyrin repeat protein